MKSYFVILSLAIAIQQISARTPLEDLVEKVTYEKKMLSQSLANVKNTIASSDSSSKRYYHSRVNDIIYDITYNGPEACKLWLDPIREITNELDAPHAFQSCAMLREYIGATQYENYLYKLQKRVQALQDVCPETEGNCKEEVDFIKESLRLMSKDLRQVYDGYYGNASGCSRKKYDDAYERVKEIKNHWSKCKGKAVFNM